MKWLSWVWILVSAMGCGGGDSSAGDVDGEADRPAEDVGEAIDDAGTDDRDAVDFEADAEDDAVSVDETSSDDDGLTGDDGLSDEDATVPDDGGGPPCAFDFDCPAGHACQDGSCVAVAPGGTCFGIFDRPPRRQLLTEHWTAEPGGRLLRFTGTGRCGEHCLEVGVEHQAASGSIAEYVYRLDEEGSLAVPLPSTGAAVLATFLEPDGSVLIAWNRYDLETLRIDRLVGPDLVPGDSFAVSEFDGADYMSVLDSAHFDVVAGQPAHLFIDGASTGHFADLVRGTDGGFDLVRSVRISTMASLMAWHRFAVALHTAPATGMEVIGGDGPVERFDATTVDPATAVEIGIGRAPDLCRTPSGDLVLGYVLPDGDALAVDFLDLPAGADPVAHLPSFRAAAGLAAAFVSTGIFFLECNETTVTFALIPKACGYSTADARWGVYTWDGTSARQFVVEPPAADLWYTNFDSSFWSGAVWSEPCQGARVVVPWESGSGEPVLEYIEL